MSDADTAPAAAPVTVLVVEDSPTQAAKLRLTLERHGLTADCVASAEAALERLNRDLPDLVIADYHLPGMNGDGLVRQLRMNLRTRTLPVLMLTEEQAREHERHGLESGADAYLTKPAADDVLLARIRALLRRAEPAGGRGSGAPASPFRRARLLVVGSPAEADRLAGAFAQDAYAIEIRSAEDEALARAADGRAGLDCVIVLADPERDAAALCRTLDGLRTSADPATGEMRGFLVVVVAAPDAPLAALYSAGADDVVPATVEPEVVALRVRAIVRRKQLMDDNRRIDAELRERRLALEHANAVAAAAEARAAIAADLALANERLRETQAQLVHAAKMSSLGELVAGIAHEINNPLAFILAHHATVARLVEEIAAAPADEAVPARLAKASARLASMGVGLRRIQDLVLNLRRFSRLDEGAFTEIDVHDAIDTVLTLLSPKIGAGVAVERDYRATPMLTCSAALLNQVVMNVLSNAADAVGTDGRITVATRSDDTTYEIVVCDSGPGIPPALRDRIFEPFFTTKPVGSGTGLGLAISYGVVVAHQGRILVDDAPGGGARFTIQIPRTPS